MRILVGSDQVHEGGLRSLRSKWKRRGAHLAGMSSSSGKKLARFQLDTAMMESELGVKWPSCSAWRDRLETQIPAMRLASPILASTPPTGRGCGASKVFRCAKPSGTDFATSRLCAVFAITQTTSNSLSCTLTVSLSRIAGSAISPIALSCQSRLRRALSPRTATSSDSPGSPGILKGSRFTFKWPTMLSVHVTRGVARKLTFLSGRYGPRRHVMGLLGGSVVVGGCPTAKAARALSSGANFPSKSCKRLMSHRP